MARNSKKPEACELIDLAAELGIPSDVAAEAIETAKKTGDPAEYLRNFAAEAEELKQQDVAALGGMQPGDATTNDQIPLTNGILCTAVHEIPLATAVDGRPITADWPPRFGHHQLHFDRGEQHLKDALTRIFHGLQETNARLRGRSPDEPSRPIKSHPDALKWLLEQVSLAE